MPEYNHIEDSGERQEFATGSVRDTATGKGRFDLISPTALRRLARHYENGACKYGARNWEKGQPLSRFIDSAIRHLYNFLEGGRDEDHLAAAAWNALAAIHTETMIERGRLPAELNDLPESYFANILIVTPSPRGLLPDYTGCTHYGDCVHCAFGSTLLEHDTTKPPCNTCIHAVLGHDDAWEPAICSSQLTPRGNA